ncbi:Lysozyme 2 [Amphibalanus amphitrite]|uniref:lysozyme n=1 Tax=Amphibalanus amphitrite TaxID=1232801 RepID=A0A6A4X8B6_AMPAM|nr:Lysozyme 2 [Amphibalanus amphitrite]
MSAPRLLFTALLAAAAVQLSTQQTTELVSQQCLGCICEASTQCDLSKDCSSGYCGPFLIGNAYFVDSELTAEPEFKDKTLESCTRDPYCAAAVIRKYMAKYPRDCNGDGRQTCSDFAMIHKAGPGGCERNAPHVLKSEYWQRLTRCLNIYKQA